MDLLEDLQHGKTRQTASNRTEARLGTLERKLDAVLASLIAPQPKSYAAAAAAAASPRKTSSQPHKPQPRETQPRTPALPSKENKLVIVLWKGAPTPTLEPFALRNSINAFVKAIKGLSNVVSTISLSLKGNIIITTPSRIAVDIID